MIVRPRPGLLALLFALRGSVLPQIAPRVVGVAAVACLSVAGERAWPEHFPMAAGVAPFTVLGLALSIFLSFRNSACYDRWWEARKAWGGLIVEMRGLARLTVTLLPDPDLAPCRRRLLHRAIGFAYALNARLRERDEAGAAAPWLPPDEAAGLTGRVNPTDAVLTGLAAEIAALRRRGALSDILYGDFAARLAAMAAIQATCERIRRTPLPFAYTLLVHRTAWLYCLLLPFGLAGSLGWFTPVAAAVVAYTFFGLDALGDELEEPFGTDPNDLPIDALARLIETELRDVLGEPLPPPPVPDRFVLR
ncbi:bestrophin family protein [uncultured Methylobacterium sp.]|jgi:putative membrane protein|uniref:bestrophin family protein n=1 Tax=uncultured Methylobacterium sp. TaxID=157278 RepID=UPI002615C606|nr:bestrophin family protein [uncultured Methylobacterium sp.]